eukprot:1004140-Prorocentrum_minimum.AAC.2
MTIFFHTLSQSPKDSSSSSARTLRGVRVATTASPPRPTLSCDTLYLVTSGGAHLEGREGGHHCEPPLEGAHQTHAFVRLHPLKHVLPHARRPTLRPTLRCGITFSGGRQLNKRLSNDYRN